MLAYQIGTRKKDRHQEPRRKILLQCRCISPFRNHLYEFVTPGRQFVIVLIELACNLTNIGRI
ncbi:hypothetical protein DOT66_24440 [Ralstonia pseudosolanacearum]|nr:hypothetical protein CFM90_09605 [Ralstonia solanacearum]RAA04688.1 hypothetical protein DOT66_24440 [Ralstonia pseudosolanacearum]